MTCFYATLFLFSRYVKHTFRKREKSSKDFVLDYCFLSFLSLTFIHVPHKTFQEKRKRFDLGALNSFFLSLGTCLPALGATTTDIARLLFIMGARGRQPALPLRRDRQFDMHGLSGARIQILRRGRRLLYQLRHRVDVLIT